MFTLKNVNYAGFPLLKSSQIPIFAACIPPDSIYFHFFRDQIRTFQGAPGAPGANARLSEVVVSVHLHILDSGSHRSLARSWGSPRSLDGLWLGKSHLEKDDDWGYAYDETETSIWGMS